MTQDEIIEMVREAGGSDVGGHWWTTWVGTQSTEFLERFANLVAAKEREACAKVADGWPDYDVQGLAEAIRARGEQA
jgi:hypothetical protein